MRVCRSWGKDKDWLDRMPSIDRRDYIAAYLAETMSDKAFRDMRAQIETDKLRAMVAARRDGNGD